MPSQRRFGVVPKMQSNPHEVLKGHQSLAFAASEEATFRP